MEENQNTVGIVMIEENAIYNFSIKPPLTTELFNKYVEFVGVSKDSDKLGYYGIAVGNGLVFNFYPCYPITHQELEDCVKFVNKTERVKFVNTPKFKPPPPI